MATILVVDDYPINRKVLVTLLGYSGHRLCEAADGAEALELVRSERPDLVIADILMPTMDGYEFVRQIRSDPAIAQTRVIFYTATYLEHEARALAAACGVSHILIKPCEPEEVLRTVEAVLGMAAPPFVPPLLETFDREHLRLLTNKLSQQVDRLNATNQRLAALIELSQQLVLERDPHHILEKFCQVACDIIGAKYAAMGILDHEGPNLRYFLTSGLDRQVMAQMGYPPANRGLLGQLLAEGQPIRLRNFNGDPQVIGLTTHSGIPHHPLIHSFLGAPIASPTQLYGWLYLGDKIGAEEFSEEDERIITTLAAQVVVAYENGNRYYEIQRHAAELEKEVAERQRIEAIIKTRAHQQAAVAELSQRALVGTDLSILMDEAITLVVQTLGIEYCLVLELQMDGATLLSRAATGWQKKYLQHTIVEVTLDSLAGYSLLSSREPLVVEDWRTETRFKQSPLLHAHKVVSSASVVIHGREQPFGILGAHTSRQQTFTEDDLHFLQTVANILAATFERQRVEEKLADERHILRTLIDNLPDFIYLKDTESRFITGNIAIARLTGATTPEELIGRTDFDFFPQELAVEYYTDEQTVIQSGRPLLNQEETFIDPAGRWGWFSTTKAPLRDKQGKIVGIVGIGRDITEQKRLQEQLLQAQKMEAIGQLAGGVAHDFNNILVVITGYSELLLQRHLDDPDTRRLYVEEIKKAGERATALTRQLLAFSRKQMLQPEILNLNEVVLNMENMLRRLIGEHIELMTSLAPELSQVKADPGQLEQVMMNLAVNARDAMPQGGKLTIETDNVELDETYTHQYLELMSGPYVMLAVSDTGVGMDAETQSHLFEPFFTTKEAGEGTGLGLATSYGIIKQSGGHIAVYSEPGKGTTFKVYLPRLDEPIKPLASPPASIDEPHQHVETILVVEDEVEVCEVIDTILTQRGFTVLRASDGNKALRLGEQFAGPIHLLLTDVVMPGGMNGRELAERLVSLYPSLKVLYMSGYTDNAIVHHGVLDPDTAFLQKPFAPDNLIRKVLELLNRS
jgi:PAS domain S-box-containing protein